MAKGAKTGVGYTVDNETTPLRMGVQSETRAGEKFAGVLDDKRLGGLLYLAYRAPARAEPLAE